MEIKMRHDSHYVDDLARTNRTVGRILPISQIEPNPDQPRTEIGDLSELSSSIRQKGVLEPLLVKPVPETGMWMIIAGERRWRAANLAGLKEVPCIELDIDERSIAEIALIENMQRKDLTLWEEADGLAALAKHYGYTHDEISKKISKSRTSVTESMTLAGIPQEIREKCATAGISAKSTLLEVARQFDDAAMRTFVETIAERNLTREDIRKAARPEKPGASAARENQSENRFRFQSKSSGFDLTIKFEGGETGDRKQILQALKEVFDKVKAGDAP
ncbi:MAG: ParB/RepB/Spo0J family partition protein [Acidobacteria bacterium]|nr:ParB/RepB/Spo0J family partition protein [Acidobacteriota bacterium]